MSRQLLVWEGAVSLWRDEGCYIAEWEVCEGGSIDEDGGRSCLETTRIVGTGMTPLQAIVSLFSELIERGIMTGPIGGMDSL